MPDAKCPITMCPILAPNGSQWTGEKNAVCPQHDDLGNGGCPWWGMGCSIGQVCAVDEAEKNGAGAVASENKPKKYTQGTPKEYDCPRSGDCSWQINSTTGLCAPREAMARGFDPRIVLF